MEEKEARKVYYKLTFDPATGDDIHRLARQVRGPSGEVFSYLASISTLMPVLGNVTKFKPDAEGQKQPRFHESFSELMVILSGRGKYEIDGRTVDVRESDVLLLKPTDLHRYLPGSTHTAISVHYTFAHIARPETPSKKTDNANEFLFFLAERFTKVQRIRLRNPAPFAELMHRVLAYHGSPDLDSRFMAALCFLQALVMLSMNYFIETGSAVKGGAQRTRDRIMVNRIQAYIDEHLDQPLNPTDLFKGYYLHPNYCRNLFKASTGESVRSYIQRTRMDKAYRLVADTQLPIKEVCASVGLQDYSHFHRTFTRMFGITPATLRRSKSQS